jgi:hypothetical protein
MKATDFEVRHQTLLHLVMVGLAEDGLADVADVGDANFGDVEIAYQLPG